MRILFCSNDGTGAWFVLHLMHQGHEVAWTVKHDKYANSLTGLIPPPLDSVDPSKFDLAVFDFTGMGKDADKVRESIPVVGDSQFADLLDEDRIAGLEFMEHCGIKVPPWKAFDSPDKGIAWVKDTKKRVVFKPLGGKNDKSTTYVSKSPEDMERYMGILFSKIKVKEYVLQEFVTGTEVSTEAWFDGENFHALNHTLEEKKFMPGNLGPNTGCAGNILWMPPKRNALFDRGLLLTRDALRDMGFVGPIDLNTIATEGELFGLEWTPRFGYAGTCNLTRLLPIEFGEFLYKIATGTMTELGESKFKFAATIGVSVPPFPNPSTPTKYQGLPVDGIELDKLDYWYLSDVGLVEGKLETLGMDGDIGCPIGCSDTFSGAFAECQSAINRLMVPDLQYRNDIAKSAEKRYTELERNGWLRSLG